MIRHTFVPIRHNGKPHGLTHILQWWLVVRHSLCWKDDPWFQPHLLHWRGPTLLLSFGVRGQKGMMVWLTNSGATGLLYLVGVWRTVCEVRPSNVLTPLRRFDTLFLHHTDVIQWIKADSTKASSTSTTTE